MTKLASRLVLGCAALATAAGVTLRPLPAHAGVFIALPPVVIGPPVYPPYYGYPAYAPPPPVAPAAPAPQMSRADVPFGATCYAGFYTCAAPAQTHVGTGCSCPGLGAPSFGSVH